MIYHGNYGSSILEKGAMVYAPASSVTPMNANAARSLIHGILISAPPKAMSNRFIFWKPWGMKILQQWLFSQSER